MTELAIRVENLGKLYRRGLCDTHKTLRDVLTNATRRPAQIVRSLINGNHEPPTAKNTFWALRDVSFEIKQGEVLGVIGRNGAGKSTLLKILSRITEPTTGRVEGYGRVGSLLEVGTGFHPELTGRENVYLNGAILGMKRVEIARKFDEIVAFSEIEQFLDTPVKHYSSGMYMRLAFAVAAHLEPEILIIDEVLAVGDAAFQKKCLGKMDEVAKQGRTVLFVSHNMMAIESLCNRVIWLNDGQVVSDGPAGNVVSAYLQTSFSTLTEKHWDDMTTAPGNEQVRFHKASVRPTDGSSVDSITVRTPFVIEFQYWNLKPEAYLNLNFQLYNEQGIVVFEAGPIHEPIWRPLPIGLFQDICHIPGNLLNDGMYRVVVQTVSNQGTLIHQEEDILVFDVQDTTDLRDGWFGKWGGTIRPILEWDRQLIEDGARHREGDVF
jgi:lipopolysaccharide transport system ATP-binding protein